MLRKINIIIILSVFIFFKQASSQTLYHEMYRPQIHFSPQAHWMNDPNGMVYYKGTYHLFFQYYPGDIVWGPMHWGHATSTDIIHWQQQPIAIYPDSIGYIFSGSAVVDSSNTSGFGKAGAIPMVAIFTQHDTAGENAHTNNFQNQSIAYSIDNGKTWIKYAHNPVLKNPGITDFRDPKVSWYAPTKNWIMTLATKNCVTFYASPDLKHWTKQSGFGNNIGAHGGVWECPDLFNLNINNKQVWILLASINPGAPNGGSGTQYFVGDFNGKIFIPFDTATRWIDYGPDDYAGVTWSNIKTRKIFLGWMTNWNYATKVPANKWRSAMTIPRELNLKQEKNDLFIASRPVEELNKLITSQQLIKNIIIDSVYDLSKQIKNIHLPCRLDFSLNEPRDISIAFLNDEGEQFVVGYNAKQNKYFADRTKSGKTDFNKGFAAVSEAPRISSAKNISFTIIADVTSIEMFADDGLSVLTATCFPNKPYNNIQLKSNQKIKINSFNYAAYKSIWK